MIKISSAARLGLVATVAVGACVVVSLPATADEAPGTSDVVGVGSDIVQNSMDFLADGDTNGNNGYNTTGNKFRLFNFDATADANGRNAFTDPALSGGSVVLNPTVTLRAGTSPVQRPNGGTAGLTALINDGANGVSKGVISYVRSPNLPTAAQQASAQTNLGTPLHTIEFAADKQVVATATTTNAPTALSATDLVGIYDGQYTHWNDLPSNKSGSSDAIIPEIPQAGAGVRTVFLNALKAANNGTAISLATNVVSVQQNDPTTITGLSAAQQPDAIVPFPVGRYTLLKNGYFHDPSTPYSVASPPKALSASGISLEQGTAAFSTPIPYYIIFRESDYASTKPWQPGGTLNWVQTLFYNPGGTPWVESSEAQAILTAEGVTPDYVDLGQTTSG